MSRVRLVQGVGQRPYFGNTGNTGIATKEQSNQASSTIVALAGVVSSLLISNQVHNLHEDSLGNLSMAAAVMSKLFRNAGSAAAAGGQGAACSPPELLFLLRDFGLDMGELTAPVYLEEQLQDLSIDDALDVASICAKNGMRAMIRSAFPRRNALFLPHPGPCRAADVEAMPDSALNPSFVTGLSELASLVFARATPKNFRGRTLTGPLLVSMLRGAVEAANKSDGQLVIGSMWNSMLDAELARAAAAARAAYDQGAKELAACSAAGQAEAIHKAALAAARAAFSDAIEFADAASQAGAWAAAAAQLQVAYVVLLAKAKAAGLAALDRQGVLKRLEGCSDEKQAVQQVQVAAAAAKKAFEACLATWKDKLLPPQQQPTLAAAQHDLAADVQSLQDTAVQQVRATAAAQRAKAAAAAEQARLERERQLDGVQQAAVAAAVMKYKQAMSSQAVNSSDEGYVRLQHKVLLAELSAAFPASLPQQRLSAAQAELQQRCGELLAAGLLIVQKNKKAHDAAVLADAERAALAALKVALEDRVPRSCADLEDARRECEVCKATAVQQFKQAAAKQSSYLPSSAEHAAAQQHLHSEMDSCCRERLSTVRSNAEAAARACQQAEESARLREQALQAQHQQNALLQQQLQQQQQALLTAAMASMRVEPAYQQVVWQQPVASSSRGLLQYGGHHCFVEEVDDDDDEDDDKDEEVFSSSSRGSRPLVSKRGIPIATRTGEECQKCAAGIDCHNHRHLRR